MTETESTTVRGPSPADPIGGFVDTRFRRLSREPLHEGVPDDARDELAFLIVRRALVLAEYDGAVRLRNRIDALGPVDPVRIPEAPDADETERGAAAADARFRGYLQRAHRYGVELPVPRLAALGDAVAFAHACRGRAAADEELADTAAAVLRGVLGIAAEVLGRDCIAATDRVAKRYDANGPMIGRTVKEELV